MRERVAEREELETEEERIEESQYEVRGDLPPPTAQPAFEHDNGEGDTRVEPPHKHRWIKDGEDGTFERKTLKLGENEVHEQGEVEDDTPHPALSTTAGPAINPVPHEHARFDWATNVDTSIGPVPSPRDFRPDTPPQPIHTPPKPPSPLASPIPAPRLLATPFMPSQPVCALPKR